MSLLKDTAIVLATIAPIAIILSKLQKKRSECNGDDMKKVQLVYYIGCPLGFVLSNTLFYGGDIYDSLASKQYMKMGCVSACAILIVNAGLIVSEYSTIKHN